VRSTGTEGQTDTSHIQIKSPSNRKLSTSLLSDTTCVDYSTLDSRDPPKNPYPCKIFYTPKIKIQDNYTNKDCKLDTNTLCSPVQKIPPNDEKTLQKTPGFKINFLNSSSKKKKLKKTCKNKVQSSASKENLGSSQKKIEKKEIFEKDAKNQEVRIKQSEKKTEKEFEDKDHENYLEHEQILKTKITELNGEHGRQVRALEDHINELKKQNEKLCSLLNDKNAHNEVTKARTAFGTVTDQTLDYNRAYMALLKSYDCLKEENLKLSQLPKEALCVKCKAFTNANSELSNKILRLRSYLNS
jgi:hypothetical protein